MEGAEIRVGAVRSRLRASPEYAAAVRAGMSVRNPGAEFTRYYKSVREKIARLKKSNFPSESQIAALEADCERLATVQLVSRQNEFASGLVWRVLSVIRAAGLPRPEVLWPPESDRPPLADKLEGMEWRPYQDEAREKAARARRMVLQTSVQGGKTEIGIDFVRRVGGRALWVVHTAEIFRQTEKRIWERLGFPPDLVGRGDETDSPIVLAMVQTITKFPEEWFRQFNCLVMDEAHHAGAPTWQYVANSCVNAHDRLGLSGTMAVRDKVAEMRIEGALGPTFTAGATAELADLGFVATPRMVMLFCPPTTYPSYEEVREAVCPNWRDDPRRIIGASGGKLFRHAYERGVIENETRNRIVVGTAVRHAEAGDKFLVLCNRVPHAEALFAAVSQRLSRPSYVLSGGADEWLRDETLGSFKAVDGGAVLVCTPFFREGVSVPQIDAGFLAGAGESEIAILQAMGRMLTKRPGKDEVLIYDVLDGRDPRQEKDYLAQHRLSRVATYVRSKFRVERG